MQGEVVIEDNTFDCLGDGAQDVVWDKVHDVFLARDPTNLGIWAQGIRMADKVPAELALGTTGPLTVRVTGNVIRNAPASGISIQGLQGATAVSIAYNQIFSRDVAVLEGTNLQLGIAFWAHLIAELPPAPSLVRQNSLNAVKIGIEVQGSSHIVVSNQITSDTLVVGIAVYDSVDQQGNFVATTDNTVAQNIITGESSAVGISIGRPPFEWLDTTLSPPTHDNLILNNDLAGLELGADALGMYYFGPGSCDNLLLTSDGDLTTKVTDANEPACNLVLDAD